MGSGLCKLLHDPVAGEGDPSERSIRKPSKINFPQPQRDGHGRIKRGFPTKPLLKHGQCWARIPPEPGLPVTCTAHTPKRLVRPPNTHKNPFKYPRPPGLRPSYFYSVSGDIGLPDSDADHDPRKDPIVYSIYDPSIRRAELSLRTSKPYWIKTKIKHLLADAAFQAKAKLEANKLPPYISESSRIEAVRKTPLTYQTEPSPLEAQFRSAVATATSHTSQRPSAPEREESQKTPKANDHVFQENITVVPVSTGSVKSKAEASTSQEPFPPDKAGSAIQVSKLKPVSEVPARHEERRSDEAEFYNSGCRIYGFRDNAEHSGLKPEITVTDGTAIHSERASLGT